MAVIFGAGLAGTLAWSHDIHLPLAVDLALAVLGVAVAVWGLLLSLRRWREIGQARGSRWAKYRGRHVQQDPHGAVEAARRRWRRHSS